MTSEIINEIEKYAGLVWYLLHKNGSLSLVELKRQAKGNQEMIMAAIGWLAREDKLEMTRSRGTITVSLK